MPYSTLHGEAANTFEKIYNSALDTYKGDKQKAAQTAWAGLKKAGYRKGENGEWHKSQLAEFSMAIVKASFDKKDQTMRFRAVASDTEPDLYGESMTPELFQDFVRRIDEKEPIPEAFKSAICEETWCGGLPYPSISHFRAGPNGSNVPGTLESVYIDGNRLKSVGVLHDTDLGRAVFKSLCDDLYAQKSGTDGHDPVRISIGFLDLQHSHVGNGMNYTFERKGLTDQCPMCIQGIGGKVYQKGVLVHEAFTRVPVNPRTEAEVERSMSDAIVTKKDDAASIVGDLAEILVDKSKADVLTIKSDGSVTREPQLEGKQSGEGKTLKMGDASLYQDCYDPNTGLFKQECIDQAMMGHLPAMRKAMAANYPNASDEHPVPANDKPGKWLSLTKTERDGEHPASHYLSVGDSSKVSTWHLPVKDTSGRISKAYLGSAHAALTGNKFDGPGKGKALAKLHNLYKSAGLAWPGDTDSNKEKAMTTLTDKGKIPTAPVPGNPDMIDIFDDDELYPEVPSNEQSVTPKDTSGMGAPAGTVSEISKAFPAKPFAGKEDAAEEAAEAKKKPVKEKALVVSAKSLIQEVISLKSQGVYGDSALQAIQPHMNRFGEEIRRSLTTVGGDGGELAAQVAALTEQIAVLRAQLAGGLAQPTVNRSQVPAPRSISFNPGTQTIMQQQAGGELGGLTTDKKPFSQIAAIARKSVVGR